MGYPRAIVDAGRSVLDSELSVPHLNVPKKLTNHLDSLYIRLTPPH